MTHSLTHSLARIRLSGASRARIEERVGTGFAKKLEAVTPAPAEELHALSTAMNKQVPAAGLDPDTAVGASAWFALFVLIDEVAPSEYVSG